MSRHSSEPVRVSRWQVWKPILTAAAVGFLTAVAVMVVLVLEWHPEGMGM